MAIKVSDAVKCPACNKEMILRNSARGKFYGCSAYPKCKKTMPFRGKTTADVVRPTNEQLKAAAATVVGSPQQVAVWDAIVNSSQHMIVQARAGSGKSFTITHALTLLPDTLKIGFAAFNKHIAEELKSRVPSHVEAFTLHSLGFRALRMALGNVQVDNDKIDGILDEIMDDEFMREVATRTAVKKLVSLCKATLADASSHAVLDALADRYDVTIEEDGGAQASRFGDKKINMTVSRDRVFDLVPLVLATSNKRTSVIDMDDMIYLPVFLDCAIPNYDILFGDEAQDFNLCQQELIKRACKNGRLILVGDNRQSIYGFRGADTISMSRMFDLLSATERGCKQLPLTYSRRCPKSHIELAKQIVPDITAMDEAIEGEVIYCGEHRAAQMFKAGDMGICRVNAPLVKTAYQLIQRGIPAIVRGRDIGAGLSALVRTLKPTDLPDLVDKLERHVAKEKARLMASNKSGSMIAAVQDKADTLNALMEGANDLSELRARIDSMFSDTDRLDDKVLLSSVHRAKGLEADRVFILNPELMPHPMASSKEDAEQEMNIAYVAATRSKNVLVFVGDKDCPAFDPTPSDEDGDGFDGNDDQDPFEDDDIEIGFAGGGDLPEDMVQTDETKVVQTLAKRKQHLLTHNTPEQLKERLQHTANQYADINLKNWANAGYTHFEITNEDCAVPLDTESLAKRGNNKAVFHDFANPVAREVLVGHYLKKYSNA